MHSTTAEGPAVAAQPRPKIDGGYVLGSVAQLLTAWWAYKSGLIRLADLRAWFALLEMKARRCRIEPGARARYTRVELGRLIGGSKRLATSSLNRLQAAGLVSPDPEHGVALAVSSDGIPGPLAGFWRALPKAPKRSRVPIPRRIVRWIARGASASQIATAVGTCVRCLYWRRDVLHPDGVIDPVGRVKCSWIADVFGLSLRAAKQARADLVRTGWLKRIPLDGEHWAAQRFGGRFAVDLTWSPDPDPQARADSAPRNRPKCAESAPPDSHGEPPSGTQNPEPASGPAGFSTPGEDPESPRPTLANIRPDDLPDTGRLLALHAQAVERGKASASEGGRLAFVGMAEHALRFGRDAVRLFAWMIRTQRWSFITEGDDEAARRRLRDFDQARRRAVAVEPVERIGQPPRNQAPTPPGLSDDAQVARAVLAVVQRRGVALDSFDVFRQTPQGPGWTRERWTAAVGELDAERWRHGQAAAQVSDYSPNPTLDNGRR